MKTVRPRLLRQLEPRRGLGRVRIAFWVDAGLFLAGAFYATMLGSACGLDYSGLDYVMFGAGLVMLVLFPGTTLTMKLHREMNSPETESLFLAGFSLKNVLRAKTAGTLIPLAVAALLAYPLVFLGTQARPGSEFAFYSDLDGRMALFHVGPVAFWMLSGVHGMRCLSRAAALLLRSDGAAVGVFWAATVLLGSAQYGLCWWASEGGFDVSLRFALTIALANGLLLNVCLMRVLLGLALRHFDRNRIPSHDLERGERKETS